MSENVQKAWVSRPVGGIPISDDLGPSIVFAVLYTLLLPNIIYNFFIRKPRAWNIIQISTVIFAVERIAWCIIRAVQAAHPERRSSGGLMNYVQVTVALGFVGISSEAVKLLRCTLVHTTLPENGASKDRRAARQFYRYFCVFFELAFLGATIPGIIAGVALALQASTVLISLLAAFKVKEINRMRCFELASLTLLIMSVPMYRLCVLGIRTIDVFTPIPSYDRALFYIFHLAPEWICVSILLGTNVRARFETGRWATMKLAERERDERLKKAEEEAKRLQKSPPTGGETV
ncbi:hypothetical protein RhiXN_10578 [Rhizoctonia solani]|uniref:Uncharacterized protein n=1 Tax=Rhizoctonia solani TaxID=456999 RepID=A0A8H8T029_9AGAM|nr:uncharacterized protein RhiXN_10578 [Rhizoctonia solani]QRW24254.1 hypothetical protein RhiXN_10578 [Rhizoctonia solani]